MSDLLREELKKVKKIMNEVDEIKELKKIIAKNDEDYRNALTINQSHKKLNGELNKQIFEKDEIIKKQNETIKEQDTKIKNFEANYIRIDGKR